MEQWVRVLRRCVGGEPSVVRWAFAGMRDGETGIEVWNRRRAAGSWLRRGHMGRPAARRARRLGR